MFRKLLNLFRRKKNNQPGQSSSGEAVTNVPTAGVAVGGGVGAAQPGEAISQTNPVPRGEPVNSPPDVTPETKLPEEPKQPETPPTEEATQPESGEQQPAEEEPEEPAAPPETPEQSPPTDDSNDQTPSAPTL